MKTLEEQMAFYLRFHRNPKNRVTHYVGVPLVLFSLFVLLSVVRIPLGDIAVTPASLLVVGLLGFYFRLDAVLAVAMTLFTAVLLLLANRVCTLGVTAALAVFAVALVGGWALQLVGHAIEGRKPTLVDSLSQVFSAPILLMGEVFFAFGYKRDVAERVQRLALEADRGW